MTISMAKRIAAALDASGECVEAASTARELLRDCPTPSIESLRRKLTTVMTNLEFAKQTAFKANRDIASMLEEA